MKDLNIVCLIKQVPVPKAMKTKEDGMMDRSGKSMMNPFCQNALEEALKLRDKVGGKVTVVSMGPPNAQQSLMEALRRGADEAILLSDRLLAGSDTWATAFSLSTTLKKYCMPIDVLFAGLQTIDGDTAHVGPQVAEHLQMQQVCYVERIIPKEETLEVRRLIEGGYETFEVPLPVMLSITKEANVPRGPSLKYSLEALDKEIKVVSVEDIGLSRDEVGLAGSPTIVSRVLNVVVDRPPVILFNDGPMEDRVGQLLESINRDLEAENNE